MRNGFPSLRFDRVFCAVVGVGAVIWIGYWIERIGL